MKKEIYLTPDVSVLEIQMEQCIASSAKDELQDMGENNIYDEIF